MPYKEIYCNKPAENNDIHRKLYMTIAVVNAVNEGRINKAEFLSNKTLS